VSGFRRIGSKLAVAVALSVGLGCALLTVAISRAARQHFREEADRDARRLVETLWRSTRSGMLDGIHGRMRRTISFVAHQGDIQRVSILDHDGFVRISSEPSDEGQRRTIDSPECVMCHVKGRTVTGPPPWSIEEHRPDGPSVGVVRPVYNRPECQRAGCHMDAAEGKVLGVLYASVSLAPREASLGALRARLLFFAAFFTVVVTGVVFLLLRHMVGRPVRLLVEGTRRLTASDVDHPIPVPSRDELGELATAFNATTRKLAHAHRQLVESEKLASVGRLAAGVAHEINNPLTGILTYAEAMREELDPGPSQRRADLDAIIGEAQRCRDIVHRLLDFARQRPVAMVAANLTELVERVTRLLERQPPFQKVAIAHRLASDLPQVRIDTNQMHQVVVNLLLNAAESMPQGGVITVSTRLAANGAQVVLAVSDTGTGIPPEVRTRLFEPFFTTKPRGTGLGLAVAWGIVQRHGGSLSFESDAGRGTTFTVELPRSAPAHAAAERQEEATAGETAARA
jgi:two-component system NtrC family sensor kinase